MPRTCKSAFTSSAASGIRTVSAARARKNRAQALEATSLLNDGYRTLRDPIKRAEYLLTEEGFPIGEQRSKDVPPELLEEVFELEHDA